MKNTDSTDVRVDQLREAAERCTKWKSFGEVQVRKAEAGGSPERKGGQALSRDKQANTETSAEALGRASRDAEECEREGMLQWRGHRHRWV